MLLKGKNWWWNYFKEKFFSIFKHVRGSVTLGHGYNEVEVKLDRSIFPRRIFVAVEAEGIPVCAGNVDMVGAIKNSENSFIIYADIKSNTAVVYWLIEYGSESVDIDTIDD